MSLPTKDGKIRAFVLGDDKCIEAPNKLSSTTSSDLKKALNTQIYYSFTACIIMNVKNVEKFLFSFFD